MKPHPAPAPDPDAGESLPADGILGAETCPSCHTVTDGAPCYYCERDALAQREKWKHQ